MCVLLLTLASNLAFFVPLNMLFQASFVRCLLAVMYTLLSHTHKNPTGWIPGLLISLNHGKISIHGLVLQPFVRLVRIEEGLAEARKEEMVMVTITHGFRYNLDENLIKTGIWSPYNIITAVVGWRCRPRACNRRICSKKRPFGIHNGDNDKRDRKLHSIICGNRLHTIYRRDAKSGMGILT
jgi:hypothetical protein